MYMIDFSTIKSVKYYIVKTNLEDFVKNILQLLLSLQSTLN